MLQEIPRRKACSLFELPAEVFRMLIAASHGDFSNAQIAVYQIFFGQSNAALNHVLHAGDAEGFLVDGLKITGADLDITGHSGDGPSLARIGLNRRTKTQ